MKKNLLGVAALILLLLIAIDSVSAQTQFGRRFGNRFNQKVHWRSTTVASSIINSNSNQTVDSMCEADAVSSEKKVVEKKDIAMTITVNPFGKTKEGQTVKSYTLTNKNGIVATILDFGGVIYSLETPDRDGNFANISANYPLISEYQDYRPFFGSLVGRYGNRIALGKFTLDDVEYSLPVNNGPNSLHGGIKGFDQVIWNVEQLTEEDAVSLKLTYMAKDGEEGYPGNLTTTVIYTLNNNDELIIDYFATTDKATPINLTNHTFWNLAGAQSGTILNHILKLNASAYLPTNDSLIPTGEIANVEGTPLDFRTAKPIGQDIADVTEPQFNGGYDHCLILDQKTPEELTLCAYVVEPSSGRTMEIQTTEPAVQFYSGNFLDGSTGVGDYKYEKHSAFCLETQHYPDSPNHSEFPNTILRPGETYRHTTIMKFGVEK
ncbi:MAG: aldose epimerase family protein [Planctomycetia bacterium]|nr:aldose epimerase family protein [Planctomycetia bacterium]